MKKIKIRLEGGLRTNGFRKTSKIGRPLVNIITVVRNDEKYLEETIKSVINQTYDNVEYIIMDGGSTDGTLEIIKKYESYIDYWASENDKGIYDAMNKGMDLASGDFINNLNIGDLLVEIPIDELIYCQLNKVDVAAFQVLIDGSYIFKPRLGFFLKLNNTLHHQGTYYSKNINFRYNLKFNTFSDFDLNQHLLKSGNKMKVFNKIVASHKTDGVSHNKKNFYQVYDIIRKNFGFSYVLLAFFYFKFKGLIKRVRQCVI